MTMKELRKAVRNICPTADCIAVTFGSLKGYVVYPTVEWKPPGIASAGTEREAWEKALTKLSASAPTPTEGK